MLAPWIADLKEKAERATRPPWNLNTEEDLDLEHGIRVFGIYAGNVRIVETDAGYYPPKHPDAQFIAAARSGVPKLIAALELAMGALEEIRAWNERDPSEDACCTVLFIDVALEKIGSMG